MQIKTGYQDAYGAVRWECRSRRFFDGLSRSYHGQADLLGVWVPETRQCYLVPVGVCPRHSAAMRLTPPKNGQRRRIRLASDYLLADAPGSASAPAGAMIDRGTSGPGR